MPPSFYPFAIATYLCFHLYIVFYLVSIHPSFLSYFYYCCSYVPFIPTSSLPAIGPHLCLYLSLPPLVRLVAPSKARISCLSGHHLFPEGSSDLTCLRFKWMADDLVYRWCRPSCPASCPSSQCERAGVCMCFGVPCLTLGNVLTVDEVDVKVNGAVIMPG